jgi:capsular polysaccharide export protein
MAFAPRAAPANADEFMSRATRRVLLVTLPYGGFGRAFAGALRHGGAEVAHMVFNAGDLVDRRGPGAIVFRDAPEAWPQRYQALVEGFTDVVIYGEGRWPISPVRRPRGAPGPRLWILENGYFRPDWVTLEQGGVAADTALPRTAAAYRESTAAEPPFEPVGPVTRPLVVAVSRYWLADFLLRPLFPRHRAGFDVPPWRQCAGHLVRFLRERLRGCVRVDRIAAAGPFVLVCLQREGDGQLLRHSDLRSNAAFLGAVMDDFAAHAPADLRLVVKNHPLDPGVIDQRADTRRLAAARGLSTRVDFIDGGTMAPLCRASRGLVVNNSSAALAALGFGTPVKVLGRAFFDFEGLTHQGPLAEFWTRPTRPDDDLFRRFRAEVITRTQINGNFESPRWRARTAENVARIILGS